VIRRLLNVGIKRLKRLRERLTVVRFLVPSRPFSRILRPSIPVVVSMTSYPARIENAWLSIESLLRQSVSPKHLLLVLAEDEFPDRVLPKRICQQQKRGLDVMWTEKTAGSYDKLLPPLQEFPGLPIITCDDDKFFPRTLLKQLYTASLANPKTVVGARGWKIRLNNQTLEYGVGWTRAERGASGHALLLPGGNGCLYPPGSLHESVLDTVSALAKAPTADDLWFWGALMKRHTPMYCLGLPPHRPVRKQANTPALAHRNDSANGPQFQSVLKHFEINLVDLLLEADTSPKPELEA